MKLHMLRLQGYRKHADTTIYFSDSTFLIGENNVGKSSILNALDYLLSSKAKIDKNEFLATVLKDGKQETVVEEIILTAEFRNLPINAKQWRGFKGRVLSYEPETEQDSGLKFIYRKTYSISGSVAIETLEHKKNLKECFKTCNKLEDYISAGLNEDCLPEGLKTLNYSKKLSPSEKKIITELDELYDYDEAEEEWVKNPGGIPQNVISKLPKYLLIPAQDKQDEITGNKGTLQNTLNELFSEIKESSDNYQKAKEYLEKLSKELNPSDETTEISKMIKELNEVVSEVFPNTGISAIANLSDADKVIVPSFEVEMNSNISTVASLQGTGLIRSTVFALLRYKTLRDNKKDPRSLRPLIIGFEEPEIYLHPNAINKMRDTIYNLAESGNNQIICTTHSPYMIDISKKPMQILNKLWIDHDENLLNGENVEIVKANPFNITREFLNLQGDSRNYIKMILKIDESVSKCFFVKKVLIVEGDTEQIVLDETINKMPLDKRSSILSEWHIIRARGKAAIIPLIKYLKSMNIDIYVMHDADLQTEGAKKFNVPIKQALNSDEKLVVLENCMEDVLGYASPKSDKPFKAYKYIIENWNKWDDIPEKWRGFVDRIFGNINS